MCLVLSESGCYGSCHQGRKPCTMPGVCGLRLVSEQDLDARQSERAATAAEAARIARLQLDLAADDALHSAANRSALALRAQQFRRLAAVVCVAGCACAIVVVLVIAATGAVR